MSLTDPELDLLLEMLEDDPADAAYVQVGEELVRRTRWNEALRVLARGVVLQGRRGEEVRALELLGRVYLELGRYDDALASLAELPVDPVAHPERARVEILSLERSGRLEQARARAVRFLQVDGRDVVVRSVLERLAAPPPSEKARAADPYYTVARAEHYVTLGRADRAVRVYRKILLANRHDRSVEHRMQQLLTAASDVDDDLSAELTDPGLVPELPDPSATPDLAMPASRFATPTPLPRAVTPSMSRDVTPRMAPPSTPPPAGPKALGTDFEGSGSEDEDPTLRMDMAAMLKRYAQSGGYEEEDTVVDLSILIAELPDQADKPKRSGADPVVRNSPLRVLVLSGPNLNLLGLREPAIYGSATLDEIVRRLEQVGKELGAEIVHFQSNHEGALVDRVQQAMDQGVDGLLVNAGGYTHTSVALRDALLATGLPFVEVHLTNLARREDFRRTSLLADVARGVVQGFGAVGYELALRGLVAGLGP